MSLTAKTISTLRNRAAAGGDDTLGSGFPRAQVFRGQGNLDEAYVPGSTQSVFGCTVGEYDFSKDGAIGIAGVFGTGAFVPKGVAVVHVIVRIATALAGNTNMFFSIVNDGDLLASIANPVAGTYTGDISLAVGGVHTAITGVVVTTAAQEILLGTTVAATTAGKVSCYAIWVPVVA